VALTPIVKSFIIADAVIQDRLTNKWSVVWIFNRVMAPQFPVVHPTVAMYVKLADAVGRYNVSVEVRDATDRIVAAFKGIELEVRDRTQEVEFGVPTHMLPLEKPGKYQFQLHLNGEFLASATLEAVLMERPPAPA
jgi:hypothetical protein